MDVAEPGFCNKGHGLAPFLVCFPWETDNQIGSDIEQRETGKLHEDWYSQVLEIPPLRHRRDEVPLLCNYVLEKSSQEYDRSVEPIPEELLKDFAAHEWQGNMSELEGVLKRYVLLQDSEAVTQILEVNGWSRPQADSG